jgi:hypothetical protein
VSSVASLIFPYAFWFILKLLCKKIFSPLYIALALWLFIAGSKECVDERNENHLWLKIYTSGGGRMGGGAQEQPHNPTTEAHSQAMFIARVEGANAYLEGE